MSNMVTLTPTLIMVAVMRPLGIFSLFPLLSSKSLGNSLTRNAIALLSIFPMLPVFLYPNSLIDIEKIDMGWGFIMQELIIGLMIGFVVALPFWALDSAGFIIDTIRGSSLSSVLNPSLGEASSIFGIVFVQIFSALFFIYGGFNHVLATLYQSYEILPPGIEIFLPQQWLDLLLQQWALLTQLALTFSLPAMIIMILTDIALGLINRSAQQLNVFFLAMPLKSALVLVMLVVSLGYCLSLAWNKQIVLFDQLDVMLRLLKHE
jgi:type III secretion protein T